MREREKSKVEQSLANISSKGPKSKCFWSLSRLLKSALPTQKQPQIIGKQMGVTVPINLYLPKQRAGSGP